MYQDVATSRTVTLRFTGGALSMFGRALLAGLGSLFIIPAAWVVVPYVRWLLEHIELSDGSRIRFDGKPAEVWHWFALIVVIGYLPSAVTYGISDAFVATLTATIVTAALTSAVAVQLWRWYAANVQIGQTSDLRFDGEILPFAGFNIGIQLSAYTIIGWAWVLAAYQRWLMRHLRSRELEIAFVGSGLNILWRCLVGGIACIFIIPIPWIMRWLMAWFVEQTVIQRAEATIPMPPFEAP